MQNRDIVILGAGMAGLLAGQLFRSKKPRIIEKQTSLPNNHSALLRFRSDRVQTLTGIPFKKVKVTKCVHFKHEQHDFATIGMKNIYSQKVTGTIRSRSIDDLLPVERYIAPSDFIQQVSHGLDIEYGADGEKIIQDQIAMKGSTEPRPIIISTMPVTELARMLDYKLPIRLKHTSVWVFSGTINAPDTEVYQTVYNCNVGTNLYRVSITGNRVIAEYTNWHPDEPFDESIAKDELEYWLGIDFAILDPDLSDIRADLQHYGKLVECESNDVKEFLGWATNTHNIYSLGRWGTHRQLLMDDVVQDLNIITNMIRSEGYYR